MQTAKLRRYVLLLTTHAATNYQSSHRSCRPVPTACEGFGIPRDKAFSRSSQTHITPVTDFQPCESTEGAVCREGIEKLELARLGVVGGGVGGDFSCWDVPQGAICVQDLNSVTVWQIRRA